MADDFRDMISLTPPGMWEPGSMTNNNDLGRCRRYVDPTGSGSDIDSFANVMADVYGDISSYGGDIHIWRGTLPYNIDKKTLMFRKPVRIIQHKGAILKMASPLDTCIYDIQCPFEYYGLNAQFDVDTTTAGRAIFLLRSSVTGVNCSVATTGTAEAVLTRSGGDWNVGFKVGDICYTSGFTNAKNNTASTVFSQGGWVVLEITSATVMVIRDLGDEAVTESLGAGQVFCMHHAAHFTLHDGFVSLAATNAAVPGFAVVNATGSDAANMTPCLTVKNTKLEIRNWTLPTGTKAGSPTQQTNAWSGSEYTGTPYGIGLVRASKYRLVEISNCTMFGNTMTNTECYAGPFLLYEDCLESIVSDCKASSLTLAATTGKECLPFIICRSTSNEGGHLNIDNFFCENITAKHFLYAEGEAWISIDNVRLGRWFPGRTTSGIRAVDCRTIDLNGFCTHNVNGHDNVGTFSITSSSADVGHILGTGVDAAMKVDDQIVLANFGPNSDGLFTITAVASGDLTVTPSPVAVGNGAAVTSSVGTGGVGTGTFTRASGSYITDGFVVGSTVTSAGYGSGNNNGSWVVSVCTALTLTVLDPTDALTTEGATGNVSRSSVVTMQSWVADFDNVKGYWIGNGNQTFRRSIGKPYRFGNKSQGVRDPMEPVALKKQYA